MVWKNKVRLDHCVNEISRYSTARLPEVTGGSCFGDKFSVVTTVGVVQERPFQYCCARMELKPAPKDKLMLNHRN